MGKPRQANAGAASNQCQKAFRLDAPHDQQAQGTQCKCVVKLRFNGHFLGLRHIRPPAKR